jgi:hypothetical protein
MSGNNARILGNLGGRKKGEIKKMLDKQKP